MSGRRLALVVVAALISVPWIATAQDPEPEGDIEMEPEAPPEAPPDDGEPVAVVKDPKLARKLASAAAQLVQKGDYSTRRNKPDEGKAFYENAALAYAKAIEAGDDLNLYFDIALIDEKLGRIDVAVRHLRMVLGAKGGIRAEVTKKAQTKFDDLSMQVGLVLLQVEQDGTTVSVGGKEVGRSPFTEALVFMPGMYTLAFESDGYQPKDVEIKVEAGSEAERKIELEPIKIVVAPPRDPDSDETTEVPTVTAPPSKIPLYVGAGVTVAAFGAFVISGIVAVGDHGTFTGASTTSSAREDARVNGQNAALFSDIMLGTTVVAAGFTAYWYLFKSKKSQAKPTEAPSINPDAPTMSKIDVVPWVQPSASGLAVSGSF